MASQKCIPLILWLFISLSLGSAHRALLELTEPETPEDTQNPNEMTKPSASGSGSFGWGWRGDVNNNGGDDDGKLKKDTSDQNGNWEETMPPILRNMSKLEQFT